MKTTISIIITAIVVAFSLWINGELHWSGKSKSNYTIELIADKEFSKQFVTDLKTKYHSEFYSITKAENLRNSSLFVCLIIGFVYTTGVILLFLGINKIIGYIIKKIKSEPNASPNGESAVAESP